MTETKGHQSNVANLMQRPQWGRDASTLPVRVTYRVCGQNAVTTRTMTHNEYVAWALGLKGSGYELVHAEQVRS